MRLGRYSPALPLLEILTTIGFSADALRWCRPSRLWEPVCVTPLNYATAWARIRPAGTMTAQMMKGVRVSECAPHDVLEFTIRGVWLMTLRPLGIPEIHRFASN